jgi:DNA mismatch repair protein MutS
LTRSNLSKICDIERIHRKIQLANISFSEFSLLEASYKIIFDTVKLWLEIFDNCENDLLLLEQAISYISERLIVENCLNTPRNQPVELQIFKKQHYPELDQLFEEKKEILEKIDLEKLKIEKIFENFNTSSRGKRKLSQILATGNDNIKLEYTEKEKYYFSISHTKCKFLQEYIKGNHSLTDYYKIKAQASNSKITSKELDKQNEKYISCMTKIDEMSKKLFGEFINNFCSLFENIFLKINSIVGYTDFIQSGAYVSLENNYVSPQVVEYKRSFLDCKDLRHPLIEKILQHTVYIPNDICLGKSSLLNENFSENESESLMDYINGYLIFGTNSCGKSVFMKSVGIAVIMAQIGYDVACSRMSFSPFYNIITRMSGNDDPLKGHSSFAVEMIELNLILSRASEHSLILGDEICHGTEQISGQSLVASSLIYLCNKRVPFVFASHLHQLSEMKCIKELQGLSLKHLSVKRENSNLVYERKLKEGSGDATYGIEVAKYIIDNQDFIQVAEKIQKMVKNQEMNFISDRISRYNRNLHLENCQICGSRATETHHIIQQKEADENKMVESEKLKMKIHMNHYSNLVALCDTCHNCIHNKSGKKLMIYGYDETIKGLELKFEWISK